MSRSSIGADARWNSFGCGGRGRGFALKPNVTSEEKCHSPTRKHAHAAAQLCGIERDCFGLRVPQLSRSYVQPSPKLSCMALLAGAATTGRKKRTGPTQTMVLQTILRMRRVNTKHWCRLPSELFRFGIRFWRTWQPILYSSHMSQARKSFIHPHESMHVPWQLKRTLLQ